MWGVRQTRESRESRESQKTRESQESQNSQGTQPKIGRIPALIAAVAIVGVAIGAAAGLLTLMLYGVEHLALGYVENSQESRPIQRSRNSATDFRDCGCGHCGRDLVAVAYAQHESAVR